MASGYDRDLYASIAAVEPLSFWFRARNRLIVSMVRRHAPDARDLLDVGCGTGFVLSGLREAFPRMRLVGIELHAEALEVARRRLPGVELRLLDATRIAYDREFDVVGAFDVLEHVEDDTSALRGMSAALRAGGVVILLVPQHPRMWSRMDTISRHVRRYTRHEVMSKLAEAGLEPVAVSSYVSTLLPAMVVSRLVRRAARRPYDPLAELRPRLFNALLERVLDAERRWIEHGGSLPVGGTLVAVARKR